MTSVTTLTMAAALFQRKSRAGWLGELDEIRGEALETPDGEIANAIDGDAEDIWTDIRHGGEYQNPHEISSLYADENTLDDGSIRPAKRGRNRPAKPKGSAADRGAPVAAPGAEAAQLANPPHAQPSIDDDVWTTGEDLSPAAAADAGALDSLWTQPAPHPVHPQEMWHPADEGIDAASALSPAIDLDVFEHHIPGTPVHRGADPAPFEPAATVAFDAPPTAAPFEAALAGHLDAAPTTGSFEDRSPAIVDHLPGNLSGAPVGRRNRRDRPVERQRATLPDAPAPTGGDLPPLPTRGEQSPLTEAPLPPAALPSKSNRLPSIELPDLPGSVVAPATLGPFEVADPDRGLAEQMLEHLVTGDAVELPVAAPALDVEVAPVEAGTADVVVEQLPRRARTEPAEAVAAEAVVIEATPAPSGTESVVEHAAAPMAEPAAEPVAEPVVEPVVAAEPEPAPEPIASVPVAIGADGLVPVVGSIVRVGGAGRAEAAVTATGPIVTLAEGWTWMAPGDAPRHPVQVALPMGALRAASLSTVLAVVEADGSAFVIVASGEAELETGAATTILGEGMIAMVAQDGTVQVDEATQDEVVADPVVAENLALDAEL